MGHLARIVPGFKTFSLPVHFQAHPQYEVFTDKWTEVKNLRETQKKFQKPKVRLRHGLTKC